MADKNRHNRGKLDRRQMLKYSALGSGLVGAGLPFISVTGSSPLVASNQIIEENRKPGTTDWQLTYVRSQNYRSPDIEGYCSRTSVRPGESLDIFVSASTDTSVTIDIYRMGYYGGKGGRFITQLGPFNISPQPDPVIAEHRLRECLWERTTKLTIPDDWLSGVYLGKLSCPDHRFESYVIFIVRDDREADLLFQCSDTTWQAYNKWPDSWSLYDSDEPRQPHGIRTWTSFDRPYGKYPQILDQPLSQGSGEFLLWEYPLSYWLEQQGYDVTYCSNIDTHEDPAGLKRVKGFLSVGHDEYWTLDMFHHVRDAVDEGLNVAFLSSNSIMMAVELKPASTISADMIDPWTGLGHDGNRVKVEFDTGGSPNRIMYRTARFGGVTDAERETGIMGPFTVEAPNENTLIGARTMYPFNGSADWIVSRADHWIFEGTGLENGDRIRGLVGWEHHGDPADIPGLEVIAEGKTINSGGRESNYTATVYPGPEGNWVFNAATIYWPMGLSNPPGHIVPHSHHGSPQGEDERVQQITTNFFERIGVRPG